MNKIQNIGEVFFKTLKKCRELSPYTQQEVADKLKITIKQYQKYEAKTLPPHEKLYRLNEIFKTDLSRAIYQQNVPSGTAFLVEEPELWIGPDIKKKPDKELERLREEINVLKNKIIALQERIIEDKKENLPPMESAKSAG